MKIKKYFALAFAGLAFAACSNNDSPHEEPDPNTESGEEVYLSLNIELPKTRAYGTETGTVSEQTVNSLNVYIYDADNLSASPVVWNSSSFSETDITDAIKVKKSDKIVVVGVNLPSSATSHISGQANAFQAFYYTNPWTATVATLAADNNFVMMNSDLASARVSSNHLYETEAEALAAPVTLDVSRVVAKAAVSLGAVSVPVIGGTIDFDNMDYGWRNVNKATTLLTDASNKYMDQNFFPASTNHSADFLSTSGITDLSVNGYSSTVTQYTYTTENTFDLSSGAYVKDATYLSISTKFIPEQVYQANGGSSGTFADFDLVNNPNYPSTAVTFWTVELLDGTVNYFLDASDAEDFAAAATTVGLYSDTYTASESEYANGSCYYHVFVNTDPDPGYTEYNVYRNQYYKVTITGINGPGLPKDDDDYEDPLQPSAYISVRINVLPWTTVDEKLVLQ